MPEAVTLDGALHNLLTLLDQYASLPGYADLLPRRLIQENKD